MTEPQFKGVSISEHVLQYCDAHPDIREKIREVEGHLPPWQGREKQRFPLVGQEQQPEQYRSEELGLPTTVLVAAKVIGDEALIKAAKSWLESHATDHRLTTEVRKVIQQVDTAYAKVYRPVDLDSPSKRIGGQSDDDITEIKPGGR